MLSKIEERERPTSLEANVKKPKGSEFDEAPPQEAPARIVMPKASPMPPDRDYHRAVAKAVAVPKNTCEEKSWNQSFLAQHHLLDMMFPYTGPRILLY